MARRPQRQAQALLHGGAGAEVEPRAGASAVCLYSLTGSAFSWLRNSDSTGTGAPASSIWG